MLTRLHGEWEKVSLQTNWKLEPCTMPNRPKDGATPESGHTSESSSETPSSMPLRLEPMTESLPQDDVVVQESTAETSQDCQPDLGTD